jgi:triosephosphate isomerase
MTRCPLIVLNWKMSMTLDATRAFVERFQALDQRRAAALDLVITPPATALTTLAELAAGTPIQVGAQDLSTESGAPHTGQLSAELLADAGATWALIGHWEVRRDRGDDWSTLNTKIHRALAGGLRPILLLGEDDRTGDVAAQLEARVAQVLDGCGASDVRRMGFVYEPAWAIGKDEPATPEHVSAGVRALREVLTARFGPEVGERVQVIYGGSVTPENADALLAEPALDGLGMGRKGRDPDAVAALVKQTLKYKQPQEGEC